MPDIGLGAELQKMGYGGNLADALSKIGSMVREGKQTEEAQKTLADLAGVDMSKPEGMSAFRKAVFNLAYAGQPGQQAMGAIQEGIVEPLKLQSVLADQQVTRLKGMSAGYEKAKDDYVNALKTPGFDPNAAKEQYQILKSQYNALYPEFKAVNREQMIAPPPEPAAFRIDDKVGRVINADQYHGVKAPPGKAFQYIYGRTPDGKMGWNIAKDDEGNPLIKDLPSTLGGGVQPFSAWEGNWDLPITVDPKTGIDEAFMSSLPKQVQPTIRAMATYRLPANQVTSLMRGSARDKYAAWMARVNPTWDFQDYQRRSESVRYYASGKGHQNIVSLNQAVDHAGKALEAAEKLKNTDILFWNKIGNVGINQTGDPRVNDYRLAMTLVVEELSRAFGGKAGTIPELATLQDRFNAANSWDMMNNAINLAWSMLSDRFNAEGSGWVRGTKYPLSALKILDEQATITLHNAGRDDIIQKILSGSEAGIQDDFTPENK